MSCIKSFFQKLIKYIYCKIGNHMQDILVDNALIVTIYFFFDM